MKALLFPGQGVQKIGMLDEIINSNKEVVDYLSSASKNLDFSRDEPSSINNSKSFIQNRYDQSFLSILLKQNSDISLKSDESSTTIKEIREAS